MRDAVDPPHVKHGTSNVETVAFIAGQAIGLNATIAPAELHPPFIAACGRWGSGIQAN
jgi:hypothetical protein